VLIAGKETGRGPDTEKIHRRRLATSKEMKALLRKYVAK